MDKIVKAIKEHRAEIESLVKEKQDWQTAFKRFDALYAGLRDPADKLWGEGNFSTFKKTYFAQRDGKGMNNITLRTVAGLPEKLKNEGKTIFLQLAEACCLFNASHKVNFEADELPQQYDMIKMVPGKSKGTFTYAVPTASIYKKTSLTFDYWVPKFIEWTEEIRNKKLKDWKESAILEHESCTDFMRVCLMFLSDPKNNPPIAKTEEREALLKLAGEEFVWIKKAAKREDIPGNSAKIKKAVDQLSKECKISIPLEAMNRILQSDFIKPIIK